MQVKLITIFLALITLHAGAQSKKVALHHNGSTALFIGNNAFVDAVNAATSGDTIYIPGGFWTASNITKRLCIFGAGHHPDSSQATQATYLTSSFSFTAGADSSFLQGVAVQGDINFSSANLHDITINRCSFNAGNFYSYANHITFSENIIRNYLNINNFVDFLNVKNNFIVGSFSGGGIINIVQGALIENNIINQENAVYYYAGALWNVNGSLIRNNIIVNNNNDHVISGSNNLFQHNIFTTTPTTINNIYTNNFNNVSLSNLFVNYGGVNNFSYAENYHLQNPGWYLGTDSTQVGLYGSSQPFKEGSVPSNPHIRTVSIGSATDSLGNLNVNIAVQAQDNK